MASAWNVSHRTLQLVGAVWGGAEIVGGMMPAGGGSLRLYPLWLCLVLIPFSPPPFPADHEMNISSTHCSQRCSAWPLGDPAVNNSTLSNWDKINNSFFKSFSFGYFCHHNRNLMNRRISTRSRGIPLTNPDLWKRFTREPWKMRYRLETPRFC